MAVDMHHTRLEWLARLEVKVLQYRKLQHRDYPRAEYWLNVALESWQRIHDRLVLEAYAEEAGDVQAE